MSKHYIALITILSFFILNTAQSSAASATKWQTYDVSVLFPLPDKNNWSDLLSPTSQDNLLPFSVFENAPYLINQPNEKTYPDLRVVAVRIDPCFQEGAPPTPCQPQVRFVWQPLTLINGKTSTIDATLHVFFNLNSAEFSTLKETLQELRQKYARHYSQNPKTPLGIHPVIKKLGLQSAFAVELKSSLLNAIRGKTQSRMTFMKLKGMNDMWFFGGVDFPNAGPAQPIMIPLLGGATQQDFINEMAIRAPAQQFLGGIFPAADEESLFSQISKDSTGLEEYKENDVKNMIVNFADFENPEKHNPGTLDCVSCHLSQTTRTWSTLNFPKFDLKSTYEDASYKNANHNLTDTNHPEGRTDILRMFGYLNDQPITNQRLINESAAVADAMNNN